MAVAVQSHITEVYARAALSPATDEDRRHYGLGLALVADVAANHGGHVGVSHRPDGQSGAVFALTLPGDRAAR